MQASQFGAVVIVDDPAGRELASSDDLEFQGTLWVLQRFHELNLLASAALWECFVSLCLCGTRLPCETVNALLSQIGENSP